MIWLKIVLEINTEADKVGPVEISYLSWVGLTLLEADSVKIIMRISKIHLTFSKGETGH